MDRRAWQATGHGVTGSQTQLRDKSAAGDPNAEGGTQMHGEGTRESARVCLSTSPFGRAG